MGYLSLQGHIQYPDNIHKSLTETPSDKIRKYRVHFNNSPPSVVSFIPDTPSTSVRLHCEFIRLLFLQVHRETEHFFTVSGVHLDSDSWATWPCHPGLFHFHGTTFSTTLKEKVDNSLTKAAVLRINLNIDWVSITSRTHTHPSHSQTSRIFTSSLSLGVPVPRVT